MRGEFNEKIGLEIIEVGPERVVATMPVEGNRQPLGLLHGGANAAMAEAIGSVAALVNAAPGRTAVGLELSCTHHRAARSGKVTGRVHTAAHRPHHGHVRDGDHRRRRPPDLHGPADLRHPRQHTR